MAPEDNSLEQAYEGSAYDSSLESAAPAVSTTTAGSGFGHKRLSPFHYNKIAFLVTGIAMAVILLIGGGSILFSNLRGNKANQENVQKADKYSVGSLSVNGVKGNSQLQVGEVNQLEVNGQLQVSKTLVITPTAAPTAPTLGQVYFDKTTNAPYYYNGTSFVSLSPQSVSSIGGATGAISVGGGLNVVNSTITNTGVTSLQGQSGDVNFTSGSGIKVNGTTISNTGILSVKGTPNQIGVTNNNGDVQVSLSGLQNGGVIVGSGGGLATIKPTAVGQCLVSDSSSLPVFGSCTGSSIVQSIQVGSNTLSGALQLQATGGLAVSNSGNVITIDGSGIVAGGDVSFGATHTAGHVTALDGSGDLISTDLINQSGGLQVASSGYYLDLANAGTSTFTIKNTNGSNVANLAVTGTTQSSGLRDASGNLYGFAVSPTGSSRTVCYVDNTNASNCPTGGNVSYGASHNPNTIAALDGSGNLINSNLNVVAGGLQVVASSYSLDVKDANNSTLTVQNSTAGKKANLVVTGTISAAGLLNGSDTFTLPTNGGNGGVLCYLYAGSSNCPTGGNVSTTGTPTSGNLAVFTGANTIGNSIISDNGSLVTIGGNLAANAITAQSLQSAGALTISAAGSLTIGTSSQVLALQGNGTSTLVISSNGRTMTVGFTPLATTNRNITFPDESGTVCLQGSTACGFSAGGSGVTSLNTLTGALSIANATTSGSTITLNNASTSVKGIASFDATDFTVSSGVVSTIQPIGLASAVQFGSLTLGTGDLTLTAGHTVHADNLSSVGANLTISSGSGPITFVTDSGTNSFIFPTYGGTGQMICTIATTCAGGAGSAVILEPGTGSTSQVQSATTDRNAIFINKASGLGNLIQLQAGGSDAFVIDGSGNTTISNTVHATGNVTVDGTLTTNTIASTGALTIGSSSKQFVLQGNGSSTISATASGNTTTLGFATPTGNNSILFPDAGGTVCLSLPINNCAFAAGGSGISGSGTVGKIAKFTGTSAVGDSLLSETGSIVTVAGSLAVGVSSSINGTVIVRNSTNANTITIQQAAAPGSNLTLKLPTQSGTFAVAATGPLSLDVNTGQLSCATCLTSGGGGGSSGVISVDSLTGALNINNTSGSGTTITIDDAAADGATKGIATFNATNFTASGGVINTIQDIATSSSPTFANLSLQGTTGLTVGSASNLGQVMFKDGTNDGFTSTFSPATLTANRILTIPNAAGTLAVSASGNLSLSALGNLTISNSPTFSSSVSTPLLQSTGALSITPGGTLTVGATGQTLALQGNGSTTLSATVSGSTTTVGFTTPTAARSILFPDAAGTVCLSLPTNNCGFAAGGSGVTSLNGLTGTLSVANATGSGGTITINNAAADGSTKGIAAFNATNFTASSGVVNTVQNINTGASPSFTGLTVSGLSNGIVQSTSGVLSGGAVDRNSGTLLSNALNVSNGGTGTNTFATNGILYGNGTSALQVTSAAANSILATNGSNVPGLTQVLPTAVQGNITSTGVLAAGSIASGFGTIVTANNITTSATVQGGNVNATSALQLGGANINTAGTLNNVAYLNQANSFSAANTFTSTVAIQGGLTLGVVGTTAGSLTLATTTSGVSVSITAAPRAASVALTIPTDVNTTDIICLQLKGNCSTAAGAYIANSTAQQTSANFNIQSVSGQVAAKIQGASGQDIIDFYVAGSGTPIAKIDSTGLLTANAGLTANGAAVSLNDSSNFNTSINGGTSTGSVSIGNNNSSSAVTIKAGTGGVSLGDGGIANTLQIGNTTGAVAQTINIGNNATASSTTTLNLGSTIGSSPTTIQGGTSGILLSPAGGTSGVLVKPVANSTNAFQVQNAGGLSIFDIDNTVDASNLIANGNFETNTTGWSAVNGSGSSTISRITTQQYAGVASLQVVTSSTATNAGASYPIALSNSTQYSLSFYAKGSTTISDLIAGYSSTGLVGGQANCTLSPAIASNSVLTGGWRRYSCTFTTPGSSSGSPYIYLSQSGSTGHTMYIDNVRLEQAATAGQYKESTITLNGTIVTPALFQNANDSTTAFQIQNAAGTSNVLVADTVNGRVGIGLAPTLGSETLQTVSINTTSYISAGSSIIAPTYNKNYVFNTTASANDVLVLDGTTANRVATTTTARDPKVVGVSSGAVGSAGTTAQVIIGGTYPVNADATSRAIAIGDQLVTTTTTGKVVSDNNATTGIVGIAQATLTLGSTGTVSTLIRPIGGQYAPRFQNATDSTTAFQVQNAAGTNIFNIDTSNGIVGTAATTTTSTNSGALILQSGNASGATSSSGSVTLDSGTATGTAGAVNVGTGAYAHNVNLGNATGNTALSLQGGTGGVSITSQGGTLGIGNNAVAQTIVIGNTTGATGLTLQAGSGNLALNTTGSILIGANTLQRTAAGTTTLDLKDTSADTILSLLNSDGTRKANLQVEGSILNPTFTNGAGSTYSFYGSDPAGTYTVCSTSGNCVGSGGGGTVSTGTTLHIPIFTTDGYHLADSIITQDSYSSPTIATITGKLNVTSASNNAFQVLTAASGGKSVFNVDGSSSTVTTWSANIATVNVQNTANNGVLAIDAGTAGANAGTLNVGTANAGTVQIGAANAAVSQTIGIGNNSNASGTSAVTVGSTKGSSSLLLQGGSGGVTITPAGSGTTMGVLIKPVADTTQALQVQNAAGTALLNADSTNMRISIGSKGTAIGQLYVAGQTPTAVFGQANGQAGSYGLAIQGRYAYIVPTGSTKGIQVFDISNPASPTQVGNGVTTTSSSAKRVKIQGKYAYIAGGGFLQVFDISNPALPVSVGTQTYTAGSNTPSLYVQGRYAYVGESTTPTLYVFDISNPASIPAATSLAIASSSNGAADIYGQGRYLYLANGGTNSFQMVDISNPAAPNLITAATLTTSAITSGTPLSVVVQGRYAYLGTTTTVYAIDVSAPSTSTSVAATVTLSGAAHSLSAQGRYLYAGDATTNGSGLIRTIDISTPASATLLSGTAPAQSPLSMSTQGRYLYTANNSSTNTLQAYDMGGAYAQQLEAGGIETDTLNVRGNAGFASDVGIQGSLGIGGGLQVGGNSAFSGSLAVNTSLSVGSSQANGIFSAGSSTYSTGTISQSGTTITGSGTTFTSAMTGGTIYYNDGTSATVTYVSATSLTATSKTIASSPYSLVYGGIYTRSGGATTIQTSSGNTATAFQVQNASSQNLLQIDTTNSNVIINAGTSDVQAWSTNTNTVNGTLGTLDSANTVVGNGYIYEIGGYRQSSTSSLGGVAYAKLNANGSIGSFTSTTSLSPTVDGHGSAFANGYVYVVGGETTTSGGANGTTQTAVKYAKVQADGSLGSWLTSPNVLPTKTRNASVVTYNGYLYSIGGNQVDGGSNNSVGTTYYAKLNADGTTGTWTTTNGLSTCGTTTRDSASAVVSNGYVYVISGEANGTGTTNVCYTNFTSTGTLGTWASTTALGTGATGGAVIRNGGTAFALNGYVYNVGGYTGSAAFGTTYYAKIASDGTLGNWTLSSQSLPSSETRAWASPVGATANGYMYLIGGMNGSTSQSTVYYTSPARVQIGASLDLIGVGGTDQVNGNNGSGTLTAGNTTIVGTLQVQGATNFAQDAAIAGSLTVGGGLLTANSATASVSIGNTGAAGTIQIGNTTGAVAQTINIGTNATASSSTTLTLGSTIGTSPTVIQGGSSGIIAKSTSTAGLRVQTTGGSVILNVDTSAGRVGIGTTGGSHALDVAGSAQIYGGSSGEFVVCDSQFCSGGYGVAFDTTNSGVFSNYAWNIQSGTNSATAFQVQSSSSKILFNVDTSANGLSIGNGGVAGTIQIGNTTGAVAQTIGVGNNATASSTTTLTVGSAVGTSTTTVQGGTGGILLSPSGGSNTGVTIKPGTDSSNAFQIQSAGGSPLTALDISTQNLSAAFNGANATLKVGMDTGTSRSINAAGSVNVGGADYAEWIPWSGDKPTQGTIIDFHGSKMVVSSPTTAAFVGNDAISNQEHAILVTFTGQVPVRITGQVYAGDYLIPNSDGTAHGVAPANASLSDYFSKVATALADGNGGSVQALVTSPGASDQFNPQATSNFADINVTGTLTTDKLVVTSLATFKGNIIVEGHIITAGGQLAAQVQAAAGTSATVTVDGNDTSGTITINTGSTPQAGDLAKLIFSKAYGKAPRVVLSPSNDAAAGLRSYKGGTTLNDFMLRAKDVPAANTAYSFDYFIVE